MSLTSAGNPRPAPPSPPARCASVQGLPISAASTCAARFGMPAMPPKAMRAAVTLPSSTVIVEAAAERRNVLVEALGQLVAAQPVRLARDLDRLDEFAGLAVLLAVVEEELLERRSCGLCSPCRRCSVAPSAISAGGLSPIGRAIGDIAADRRGVAHLGRAIAADHLAQDPDGAAEHRRQLGDRDACADADAVRHPLECSAARRRRRGRRLRADRATAWSPRARHRWPRRPAPHRDARHTSRPDRPRSGGRRSVAGAGAGGSSQPAVGIGEPVRHRRAAAASAARMIGA